MNVDINCQILLTLTVNNGQLTQQKIFSKLVIQMDKHIRRLILHKIKNNCKSNFSISTGLCALLAGILTGNLMSKGNNCYIMGSCLDQVCMALVCMHEILALHFLFSMLGGRFHDPKLCDLCMYP